MKNYILVHGAWGGAWEFKQVGKRLSADGSQVTAIDLPGHGDNLAPIAGVTMAAYVQKVTELINDQHDQVILVGHSLAGSIISQVAENIPQKIDRLIYVAALLPRNGDSALEILQNDAGSQLMSKLIFSEDQSAVTLKNQDIVDVLLHDVDDPYHIAEMVDGLSIEQAVEPFTATTQLSENNFAAVPKFFIRATLDRVMSLALQNKMINNWNVEQVFTLSSGHFPLSSIPEKLVAVLNKAAEAKVPNRLIEDKQAA